MFGKVCVIIDKVSYAYWFYYGLYLIIVDGALKLRSLFVPKKIKYG